VYTLLVLEFLAHNQILFYGIVFLTSVLSASFGIGSFILIPIAAIAYGSKESIGIITIYFLFQNINKLVVFREHINWKVSIAMILWSLPGVLIGSVALSYLPVEFFNKILGLFILGYLANDMLKLIPQKSHGQKTLPFFGLLYGFMSGLVGSGNLVKGPLFTSLGLLKESYIATYAITSFFTNLPKIFIYYSTGVIDNSAFLKSIPFLFISIVGTWVGKHLITKFSNKTFYYILNLTFAISAMALLF